MSNGWTYFYFLSLYQSLFPWLIYGSLFISSGPRLEIGEGNSTPLHSTCLENPMDRGAWQAAVHGVAKSRT